MIIRFVPLALLLALAACGGREAVRTHAGPPVYRDQDLEEASASVGRHLDSSERLSKLETEMTAVKIELSRLSGAAQRIEARQLQSGGVGPEPASAAATALDGKKHGKKAPVSAPEKVAAQGPDLSVSDKAMAAIQETQNIDAAAHGPAKAAEPKPPAPAAEIPAPAEAKTARAEPAQTAPPASVPAGNPGFGLQLGAYASSERAIAAWNGLKDQGGKLLADLLPKHEAVTVGDKTMYRLKAGPLPDEGAAQARCAELKAQSIQCLVAPFSGEWPSS